MQHRERKNLSVVVTEGNGKGASSLGAEPVQNPIPLAGSDS